MRSKQGSPARTAVGRASGQDLASRSICSGWERTMASAIGVPSAVRIHSGPSPNTASGVRCSVFGAVSVLLYPTPCERTVNVPLRSPSWPPKLADIARSTGVARACSQGRTGTPTEASSSATPDRNGDEPVQVASTWSRRSSRNSGSTSISRVAAVTLWTTSRTRRHRPRVAHLTASGPTGTRTQCFRSSPTPPPSPSGSRPLRPSCPILESELPTYRVEE